MLESLPKEASRIIKEHYEVIHYTKRYLERTQDKDAETHIYTEHYVHTLTNLLPFRDRLDKSGISNHNLSCKQRYNNTVDWLNYSLGQFINLGRQVGLDKHANIKNLEHLNSESYDNNENF